MLSFTDDRKLETCMARERSEMKLSGKLAMEGGEPAIPAGDHKRWPEILQEDKDALMVVLDRGQTWGPHAPEVSALQEEWAEYVGARHCMAVNSGTAALHCGVAASGVRPGDEVIMPAFSFVATPMSVLQHGAVPVFCDIDPRTYNMDAGQLEGLITERTRAVMPVHVHGLPADMDEINAIAARHDLKVIEDAAQAHGATYKGKMAGSLGFCAGFSLNGSKNLSAGEGGLFTTDDEEGYVAARRLAIFGEDALPVQPGEGRAYWSHGVGWNYRTTEFTAAFARSQLRRLDGYIANGQKNAAILSEGLSQLPGIEPPCVPEDRTSSFYTYRIRLDAEELGFDGSDVELRDRFLYALRAEGVAASLWQWLPMPAQPVFRRGYYTSWYPGLDDSDIKPWDRNEFPETMKMFESTVCIGVLDNPLFVQDAQMMESYLEVFEKVLDRRDALFASSYEPYRVRPQVPAEVLW